MRLHRRLLLVAGFALAAGACGGGEPSTAPTGRADVSTTTASTTTTVAPTSAPAVTVDLEPAPVVIELRLDRQATAGTEDFETLVVDTLLDPRGWTRAGFEFRFPDGSAGAARYTVLLAEPEVVDVACLPYDTGGRWSCQNGPTVALNADRWREATPTWPGSLDDYRRMLVNHEVGHLLGRHHARPACADGGPAAVMYQQSSGVGDCQPNPWPLDWEIACAARHDEPVAPPYEADAEATCGPDDV